MHVGVHVLLSLHFFLIRQNVRHGQKERYRHARFNARDPIHFVYDSGGRDLYIDACRDVIQWRDIPGRLYWSWIRLPVVRLGLRIHRREDQTRASWVLPLTVHSIWLSNCSH